MMTKEEIIILVIMGFVPFVLLISAILSDKERWG